MHEDILGCKFGVAGSSFSVERGTPPYAHTPKRLIPSAELQSFRVKTTESGRARFEHRSGAHDDLVLALALALWQARRQRQGRVYRIV